MKIANTNINALCWVNQNFVQTLGRKTKMPLTKEEKERRRELKRMEKEHLVPSVLESVYMELEQLQDKDDVGKRRCIECNKILSGKKRNRCQPCQSAYSMKHKGSNNKPKLHACESPNCDTYSVLEDRVTHEGIEICSKCFRAIYDPIDRADLKRKLTHPEYSNMGCSIANGDAYNYSIERSER